jgi:hypothetical protein
MKKVFTLSVVILFSVILASKSEPYSLEILPLGSLDVTNNHSTVYFDIILYVDSDIQLGNWGFDIIYDSAELSWDSTLTTSGLMPSPLVAGLFGDPFENISGLIHNFSASLSPPDAEYITVSNDLVLATIVFNVIAGAADGHADIWINKEVNTSFNINNNPVSVLDMITNAFDSNQNCVIGNFELLNAIDLWVADSAQITNFDLLDLIDLWSSGSYC